MTKMGTIIWFMKCHQNRYDQLASHTLVKLMVLMALLELYTCIFTCISQVSGVLGRSNSNVYYLKKHLNI